MIEATSESMNETMMAATATEASDALRLGENRFCTIVAPARGDDGCLVKEDGLPGHPESGLGAVDAHCSEEPGGADREPA
jgi:hypothetical protein